MISEGAIPTPAPRGSVRGPVPAAAPGPEAAAAPDGDTSPARAGKGEDRATLDAAIVGYLRARPGQSSVWLLASVHGATEEEIAEALARLSDRGLVAVERDELGTWAEVPT